MGCRMQLIAVLIVPENVSMWNHVQASITLLREVKNAIGSIVINRVRDSINHVESPLQIGNITLWLRETQRA